MLKQHQVVILIFFLMFSACNNKSGQVAAPSNDKSAEENESKEQAVAPSLDPVNLPGQQVEPLAIPVPDEASKTAGDPDDLQQKVNKTVVDETEVKFNPPHGEPGHRCDVAVGAIMSTPTGIKICK